MQQAEKSLTQTLLAAIKWVNSRLRAMPDAIRIMIFTLVFGFITHGFFYSNMLLAHDNILTYAASLNAFRWSTQLFNLPRAFLQLPWATGLISLLELGLVNILISRMFSLRKLGGQFLLVITTITFPSVIAFHNFGSVDVFTGSLLCSVAAVFFFSKMGWGSFLLSILFLTISIASYQAFVSTAAALMLVLLLLRLTIGQEKVKPVLLDGGKALLTLIISVAVYYIVYLILKSAGATGATGYRNEDAIGVFTMRNLLDWTWLSYKTALLYYLGNTPNTLPVYIQAFQLICLAVVFIFSIDKLRKQGFFHHSGRVVLTLIILLVMPLAINVIQLLNSGLVLHQLMTFAFITPWILILRYGEWLTEQPSEAGRVSQKLRKGLVIVCALLICSNAYYGYIVANADYVARKLNYDASVSLATRIVDRIENIDGYTLETPVVFTGDFLDGDNTRSRKGFGLVSGIAGSYSYTGQAMTYNNELGSTVEWFISTVLSSNMVFVSSDKIGYYSDLDAVIQLDSFPEQDCYTWIDGVLVVKLND